MKRIMSRVLTVLAAVVMLGAVSLAQTPKRIDFAKEGSPALVWEERVAANSSKSFVFYAKKGQKLTLSFIDDTNQGSMDLGKVSVEPNGDGLEMEIEVSKDYTFTVSNNSNKATSFRIAITLEDAKAAGSSGTSAGDDSGAERVRFAAGETSASLTREIPANGTHEFIINAKKGQTMSFTVGYDFRDSDVEAFLTEPGLQDVSLTSGPKKPNEFVIQKTGDHRLLLTNTTRKKITVTLYLDIETASASASAGNEPGAADEPVFEEEKVQFPKGATDTTLEQTIAPGVHKTFLFGVRKGQTLWFKVTDKTGKISIDFNKNTVKPNVEVRQSLNAAGEWAIYVSNQTNKPISYTLWIGIE